MAPWLNPVKYQQFLRAMGIDADFTADNRDDLQGRYNDVLQAAQFEFESACRFSPFVVMADGGGSPLMTTRKIQGASNGVLDLGGGIVGRSATIARVNYDGSLQTAIAVPDAAFSPADADGKGKPFTYLKIGFQSNSGWNWNFAMLDSLPGYGQGMNGYGEVAITAYWGYALTCPANVATACYRYAAIESLQGLETRLIIETGNVTSQHEGPASVTYGTGNFSVMADEWRKAFYDTAHRIRRVTI